MQLYSREKKKKTDSRVEYVFLTLHTSIVAVFIQVQAQERQKSSSSKKEKH